MKKQITKIAAIIILTITFTAGAAAQNQTNDISAQIISLTGIETVKAIEPISGIFYGNAFVLNSLNNSGQSETHHFTISLDYLCEPVGGSSQLSVTGGSWSLVVFRDNIYAGTLYGKVSGGTIDVVTNRNGEPGFRQMQIKLEATGGLGRLAAGIKTTNTSGVYEAITDASSNQTKGSVSFAFRL